MIISLKESKTQYTHGITIRVRIVDETRPPITASAIGDLSEALSPIPIVRGTSANIVVRLVIKIGLILCEPAVMMESFLPNPVSRNWLIRSIRIIALLTAIPPSIIIPMYAIILRVFPKMKNVRMVPTKARGIVNKITKG